MVTVAILVTYARIEPDRLYHVSGAGIRGGLGRALVFLGFPVALVAIALVALVLGPVVHPGHHHGVDGVLLVLTALLLSRELGRLRPSGLRRALAGYLSLMLVYGLANVANDAWGEQVVKRGWSGVEIPNVLLPAATFAWLGILAGAAAVYLIAFRRSG